MSKETSTKRNNDEPLFKDDKEVNDILLQLESEGTLKINHENGGVALTDEGVKNAEKEVGHLLEGDHTDKVIVEFKSKGIVAYQTKLQLATTREKLSKDMKLMLFRHAVINIQMQIDKMEGSK